MISHKRLGYFLSNALPGITVCLTGGGGTDLFLLAVLWAQLGVANRMERDTNRDSNFLIHLDGFVVNDWHSWVPQMYPVEDAKKH